MAFFQEKDEYIMLNVRVVPRASKDMVSGVMGEALKVRIQAPPVAGKANAYLIRFFSKRWKIPRASIQLLSGETGRTKRFKIIRPTDALRHELRSLNTPG